MNGKMAEVDHEVIVEVVVEADQLEFPLALVPLEGPNILTGSFICG